MKDKICLITGATSGIGLVSARELARKGALVVLVGRNSAKCDAVTKQIQAETGNPDVEALVADLASQEQVRDLAGRFRERHSRLDVLINNAGAMWLQRELTGEGLEMTFAVNHLAYFLLTQTLLDTLKASAPSRIVNVSSDAHRGARIDFDDPMGERRYAGWKQYCRSKLMNLLFTYELSRRLHGSGVTANALDPGWVATGFASNNGWRGRAIQLAARWFALTPEQGARTIMYLASSPEVAGLSGQYFVREQPVRSSAASYDEIAAKQLWQVSTALIDRAPATAQIAPP
jgi:NAD(P)-dependent dehydrogenase (short-subunit alcohol dehydrogenase family)